MRFLSAAVCTTVAAALLAACSSNGSSPSSSVMPGGAGGAAKVSQAGHHGTILSTIPKQFIKVGKYHLYKVPASFTAGIATQQFYSTTSNVIVFPKNNSANGPAVCSESTGTNVNDVASDSSGNLIVPNAFSGVNLYAPPFTASSCGTLLTTITDSYGQASDAAALDGTSFMVIGNIGGTVCTSTAEAACVALSSPGMSTLAGVAIDKAGNCYADAFTSTGSVGLWVYTGCTGTGVLASGFSEPYYGGLDVDNKGNLVVVSLFNASFTTPSTVTTYSGCATGTCTVVSGPTALTGESVFGHVGRQGERFVTADITNSDIEVYSYNHATGLGSMLYNFNNGLHCASYLCEAGTYMPSAQK